MLTLFISYVYLTFAAVMMASFTRFCLKEDRQRVNEHPFVFGVFTLFVGLLTAPLLPFIVLNHYMQEKIEP